MTATILPESKFLGNNPIPAAATDVFGRWKWRIWFAISGNGIWPGPCY